MKESTLIRHLDDFKNEIIREFRNTNNPVESEQPFNEEYAIINGIRLKRKNETLHYCEHFTFEESLELAKSRGLRVPSKDEWVKMLEPGHTWDDERGGLWIGKYHEDQRETDYSTLLPVLAPRDDEYYEHYWSSTVKNAKACAICVITPGVWIANKNPCYSGFSVRCIVP
jgi:hypothetical protein